MSHDRFFSLSSLAPLLYCPHPLDCLHPRGPNTHQGSQATSTQPALRPCTKCQAIDIHTGLPYRSIRSHEMKLAIGPAASSTCRAPNMIHISSLFNAPLTALPRLIGSHPRPERRGSIEFTDLRNVQRRPLLDLSVGSFVLSSVSWSKYGCCHCEGFQELDSVDSLTHPLRCPTPMKSTSSIQMGILLEFEEWPHGRLKTKLRFF